MTVFDTPASLEKAELGSVCFVRDYVELCFDGPILRSLVGPTAESGGVELRFPEDGSHVLLCSFIGRAVDTVEMSPENIVLRFGADRITVPLRPGPGQGFEAAHFVPEIDGKLHVRGMMVW